MRGGATPCSQSQPPAPLWQTAPPPLSRNKCSCLVGSQTPPPRTHKPNYTVLPTLEGSGHRHIRLVPEACEILLFNCRTTSTSTYAPCQPLLRAFSRWIRSPPPTRVHGTDTRDWFRRPIPDGAARVLLVLPSFSAFSTGLPRS